MAKAPAKKKSLKSGASELLGPPPPCTCCDGKGAGIMFCEDNVVNILAWPPAASALAFDPTVSALPFWKAL